MTPATKLVAYVGLLAVVLAAAMALGTIVGPIDTRPGSSPAHDQVPEHDDGHG